MADKPDVAGSRYGYAMVRPKWEYAARVAGGEEAFCSRVGCSDRAFIAVAVAPPGRGYVWACGPHSYELFRGGEPSMVRVLEPAQ